MADLNIFNDKIKYELSESKSDDDGDFAFETEKETESENDTQPAKGKKDSDKGGYLGVRKITAREVTGRVNKDFDWEIDYEILRKAICKEVMTVDVSKTKKMFKLFKDYMNNKEKFEAKYNS